MDILFASNPLLAARLTNVTFGDSLMIALIGTTLVFLILILLMYIIQLMGKAISAQQTGKLTFLSKLFARKSAPAPAAIEADNIVAPTEGVRIAKGSGGQLTLINTEERDAAMIMAIVADATQTPLNQLYFKSIKRIDGGLSQ